MWQKKSNVVDELGKSAVIWRAWEGEDGTTSFPAHKEEAFIEVSSYGGDTTGYQIPFTLHFTGNKVKGTFDVKTKTFTAQE